MDELTAGGALTQVAQSAGSGGPGNSTWTYTYDARGNRLTAVVTGASPSLQTLTMNSANQITTAGYTFDGTGNMTADTAGSYAYNGAQQMRTVTQGANTFAYKYAGASQSGSTLDILLDPNNANRYAYAGNDPINNIDPTGLYLTPCQSGGITLAAGFVTLGVSYAAGIGAALSGVGTPAALGIIGGLAAGTTAVLTGYNDFLRDCTA